MAWRVSLVSVCFSSRFHSFPWPYFSLLQRYKASKAGEKSEYLKYFPRSCDLGSCQQKLQLDWISNSCFLSKTFFEFLSFMHDLLTIKPPEINIFKAIWQCTVGEETSFRKTKKSVWGTKLSMLLILTFQTKEIMVKNDSLILLLSVHPSIQDPSF